MLFYLRHTINKRRRRWGDENIVFDIHILNKEVVEDGWMDGPNTT